MDTFFSPTILFPVLSPKFYLQAVRDTCGGGPALFPVCPSDKIIRVKFLEVAQFFQKLEETTSRLEMSQLLYELFSKADKEEIGKLVYLTMGELVPSFVGLEFGVSEKLALEALSKAVGIRSAQIQEVYKRLGDVGRVAMEVIKREGRGLSLLQVYDELMAIAKARGTLDKVMLLINLLKALSGVEAKFALRIIVGNLRLGSGHSNYHRSIGTALGRQVLQRFSGKGIQSMLRPWSCSPHTGGKRKVWTFGV
jgi:hypothetical protein